jgi:hypothetical protein
MRREKKEKGAVSWENYFFLINWWESGKKLESMWAHGEVGGASLAPLFMAMLFSVRIVDLGGNTSRWILCTGKYYSFSVLGR